VAGSVRQETGRIHLPGWTLLAGRIPKWPEGRGILPYLTGLSGVGAVTVLMLSLDSIVHTAVVPLVYFVLVLFVASASGMAPAIVCSLAGAMAFNYYFLSPANPFDFRTPEDWSILLIFLVTSVTAGQLSTRARRRALDAEQGYREVERLFGELHRENAERKRAQEALETQAAELREHARLLDLAHDAIIVRDLDGRILYWNQGAADSYGWRKVEAVGRYTHELLNTRFFEPFEDIVSRLKRTGFWEGELERTRRDGRRMVMASRWVLKRNGGGKTKILEINNDITERKNAEQQLRKAHDELELRVLDRTRDLKASNELLEAEIADRKRAEAVLAERSRELARSNSELEQFAYVASHDLQEPLRMVGSYVQLLERNYKGLLDAKGREYVEYAVDGAKRMQMLINDLLAYSRVRTQGEEFVPVDCGEIVRQAIGDLQAAIDESGAAVICDSLPVVFGDRTQLTQLFRNLLSNAVKFRGERSPEVRISAEQADGKWRLVVKDNGIGIDPQYFERIFLIFQRLHPRRLYPGTGIGLAICKRIVDRHGGAIWVESEPGGGAAFYFTLPGGPGGAP
jgi:PAS domain S-box-containing protein